MHPAEQLQWLRQQHEYRVHLPRHPVQQGDQHLRALKLQCDRFTEYVSLTLPSPDFFYPKIDC